MEHKIDMVIPYVDNQDQVWQKAFMDFCVFHNLKSKICEIKTERYADNVKLIEYQLKLINKNMPWVNTIYLLLMNREQAPKDLPNNVKIVYHAQFIPKQFLPTFNSTTIEMFLWNIKELGNYFIYANDDMLPMKPLKPSDFFTENGQIKIEWWEEDIRQVNTVFRQQCLNSYRHTAIRLGMKNVDPFYFIRPAHSFTPMIKSHCVESYELLKDLITKHIRAFRTIYQYNQYIYPIYERLRYGTQDSSIDFLYTQCENGVDLDHDIVCLNIIPPNYKQEIKERLDKAIWVLRY